MPRSSPRTGSSASGNLFRPNVAVLLERQDGAIFIAERIDFPGAWQFPQGGVDEGEDLEAALRREILEETGLALDKYEIIEQRGAYRYRFPERHRKRGDFLGQEQTYFRCAFTGEDSDIDLETAQPEFSAFRWIEPAAFDLDWLPEFKREVYQQVLADFYGA